MADLYTFDNIKNKTLTTMSQTLLYGSCPINVLSEMPSNINVVPINTTVTILSMNKSNKTNTYWYMISYNNGYLGWINNGTNETVLRVEFIQQGTEDTTTISNSYQYKYLETLDGVLLSNATVFDICPKEVSDNAQWIEHFKLGYKVDILDMAYSKKTLTYWYKISYGKTTGWINNGANNNMYLNVKFNTSIMTKTVEFNYETSTVANSSKSSKSSEETEATSVDTSTKSEKVENSKITSEEIHDKIDNLYDKYKSEIENTLLSYGVEYSPNNNMLWYTRFDRFGVVNPYNALMGNTKEYLFFVKPDLNLVYYNKKNDPLNTVLSKHTYFKELYANNKEVINALQFSIKKTPFIPMLTNAVNSSLQIQNMEADTVDGPANIYGTSIEYMGNSEKSNENISFSLEFEDDIYKGTYQLFKAYAEYNNIRKKGLMVLDPDDDAKYIDYLQKKILYDRFGIYKIVVGADGETIVYYAYVYGAMPMTVPRDAFSEPEPGKRIVYNIDWKAPFMEDMNPLILYEFQNLCNLLIDKIPEKNRHKIPWYTVANSRMSGKRGRTPSIELGVDKDGRRKYKLVWYYDEEADKKKPKGGLFDDY